MTPLRQQRANRALTGLYFQLLCPKLKAFPQVLERPVEETPERAIGRICSALGLPVDEVMSRSNKEQYSFARHIIAYYLYEIMGLTYSEVGRIMNRGHAGIIYSVRQYHNLRLTKNRYFMEMINKLSRYEKI